jgi:hypothetical protein
MWETIDRRQMNPDKKVFDLEDFNTLDDVSSRSQISTENLGKLSVRIASDFQKSPKGSL